MVPLWVYRRHSLSSRQRRQHDVLALAPAPGGCCSSMCCCCYCCCCGRCSSTRRWWPTGSHPTESLVEQGCVSSRYWLCVSWAESSCPTESRREKTTKKQQLINVKISRQRSVYMHVLVRNNTWAGPWAGPSNPRAGPRNCRDGHIEPVFHGPRCHVMGRAGSGRDV